MNGVGVYSSMETKLTLGESLDHYGEEYCTRAVNAHEELLQFVKMFGDHRHFAEYPNQCAHCKLIAKAEGK